MWLPSLSCQLLTLPPTNGRPSKISTSWPASARSIAQIIPARPPPMTPTLSLVSLTLPGPARARAIRSSLRNASLPSWRALALRDGVLRLLDLDLHFCRPPERVGAGGARGPPSA